jgi:hypothetical protein
LIALIINAHPGRLGVAEPWNSIDEKDLACFSRSIRRRAVKRADEGVAHRRDSASR